MVPLQLTERIIMYICENDGPTRDEDDEDVEREMDDTLDEYYRDDDD
jgi:hypothetical protein